MAASIAPPPLTGGGREGGDLLDRVAVVDSRRQYTSNYQLSSASSATAAAGAERAAPSFASAGPSISSAKSR